MGPLVPVGLWGHKTPLCHHRLRQSNTHPTLSCAVGAAPLFASLSKNLILVTSFHFSYSILEIETDGSEPYEES